MWRHSWMARPIERCSSDFGTAVGWVERKAIPIPQAAPFRGSAMSPGLAHHTLPRDARRRGVDAKETLDPPDDAPDRSGDDGTDRAGDAIAFIRAINEAAWKTTLRLGGERYRGGCDDDAYA